MNNLLELLAIPFLTQAAVLRKNLGIHFLRKPVLQIKKMTYKREEEWSYDEFQIVTK